MHVREVPRLLFGELAASPGKRINSLAYFQEKYPDRPKYELANNYQNRRVGIASTEYPGLWMRLEDDDYNGNVSGLFVVRGEQSAANAGTGGLISVIGNTSLTGVWAAGRGQEIEQGIIVACRTEVSSQAELEQTVDLGRLLSVISNRIVEIRRDGVVDESRFFQTQLEQ